LKLILQVSIRLKGLNSKFVQVFLGLKIVTFECEIFVQMLCLNILFFWNFLATLTAPAAFCQEILKCPKTINEMSETNAQQNASEMLKRYKVRLRNWEKK